MCINKNCFYENYFLILTFVIMVLQMSIDCTMSVIMAYYNSRLALWEPLIEPIEGSDNGKRVSTPWELKTKVILTSYP